ncbi:MAG: NAD(P)H-binding protein [Acidobacteria bacterium]|nr:NAD(P)H-binding protein [Acidobacteriota bacterium]
METGRKIFIAGGTGYLGGRLIPVLTKRGHQVTALVRAGSENKLPPGCTVVRGDALDENSYRDYVPPAGTFVHLVGVPHPSPSKAALFRSIDLAAVRASVAAAVAAGVSHFIYLSVAHPAPVMKAYVQTRIEAEELIRSAGLNATFLRPWYVLGPAHRWAYALLPLYWLLEHLPGSRETALRLGLVTIEQMIGALASAVENPCSGIRTVDVTQIRQSHRRTTHGSSGRDQDPGAGAGGAGRVLHDVAGRHGSRGPED